MAHGPTYRVPFRRRREGRTDYKQRLALLKAGKPRAVVRLQNKNTIVQLVAFDPEGDRVLAQATSLDLEDLGWEGHPSNLPAAYLTGLLAGTRAQQAGIGDAVLDLGLHKPASGGRLFAALQGLLDAGLDVPHGETVLPEEDRVQGSHISEEIAAMTEEVKNNIQEAS